MEKYVLVVVFFILISLPTMVKADFDMPFTINIDSLLINTTTNSNTTDEIFSVVDNDTFQYKLSNNCTANKCVYAVLGNGTMLCTDCGGGGGNTTDEIFKIVNNNTFQHEIGADCSAGDFVKGVNDDGTLDCSTPTDTDTISVETLQNITGTWDLNQAWTNFLLWGNITGFDLNVVWSGQLWYENISGLPVYSNSTYNSSYESTYNATYDSKVSDNTTWNEQTANSLYYLLTNPSGFITSTYNSTYNSWAYNQTTAAINWVQQQNYLTSFTETEPMFNANWSYINSKPNNTFNETYDSYTDTVNSTADIRNAINSTGFIGYYNITTQQCYYVFNITERNLFLNIYNSSYEYWNNVTLVLTYNSTYDAKISDNSTWNETRANSLYYLLSNPSGYITKTYNATYDANIDTANTTSQIISTINNSASYNIQSRNSTYVVNTSYESTYNDSYNFQLGHNTTAEIQAAQKHYSNSTYNSSYEYWMNASLERTYNQTYDANINTANSTSDMITAINNSATYNIQSRNATYVVNSSYESTYNSSYDVKVSDNATWNEQVANSLYYLLTNPSGYITKTFNLTYDLWAYNQTTPAITWVQQQNYLTTYVETDPLFSANWSYINSKPNSTYNETYDSNVDTDTISVETFQNITGTLDLLNTEMNGSLLWSNITGYDWGRDTNITDTNCSVSNSCPNIQYGTELWNTTTQIQQAQVHYSNSTYNSSYEYWNNATLMLTYNATYNNNINTANTTQEMIVAVNNSATYNIQSKNSSYVVNTSYESTYNSSYEYWKNATLEKTYNATYDNNINTANSSADMITAVNNSGSYNIQSKNASYVVNSSYESTYNSSYEYWKNASLERTYNATYDQNIDTANTTSQIINAINNSATYNIQVRNSTYVVNNSYEATANSSYEYWNNITLVLTYNSTYDAKISDNSTWNESRANSLYYLLTNPSGFITSSYNSTYDANIDTANTTSQMQAAINSSGVIGYYNITAQQCYYLSNATDRAAFISTFNSTYDSNINTANTTSQMISAVNNSATYNIQAKNSTYVVNTSYEYYTNTSLDTINKRWTGTLWWQNVTGADWGRDTNLTAGGIVTGNITMNDNIHTRYGTSGGEGSIYSNTTCMIIEGTTSRLEIC